MTNDPAEPDSSPARSRTFRDLAAGADPSVAEISERHRKNRQLAAFAEFAQALAVASNTRDVATSVRNHLAASLGAVFANLGLVNADAHALRMDHQPDLDADIADRYALVALDGHTPLSDAARTGEAIIIEDRDANAARYPDLVADTVAAGLHATASLPLVHDGEVLGVLGVAWDHPIDSDDLLVEQLTTIAKLTAGTVARTRTTDLQTALIAQLQHHLLPAVPTRPELEIAVRYRAAGAGAGFGGDWYDVIALDQDRTTVIVGDIVGHGIEAAAQMAVVRTAINAVVRLETPITDVVAMDEPAFDSQLRTMIGTAVICMVDRSQDTIEYVSAGHPPLILRGPEGSTVQLEAANGPVLGVTCASRRLGSAPFPPGSMLVAYTDGLVERRGASIDAGIAAVRSVVDASDAQGLDVESTADAIIETAGSADDLTDDIALIIVRHSLPTT